MTRYLLLFLLCFPLLTIAQTDKEQAYEYAMEAIEEMDAGNTVKAINLLEKAMKLDPDNVDYPYETAYAKYLHKDFKGAIKILKKLTSHKDANDRVWQMLGNAYDMDGDGDKAIQTYDKALKKFPHSGILHLERGNMEMAQEKYLEALDYYEMGIKAQPDFPSNYYWASIIYLASTESVWGMIYGEIFMNIELNGPRNEEISRLLFENYQRNIDISSDTSASVSFSKYATLTLEDLQDTANFKLPFGMGAFEPTMLLSILGVQEINLASLDKIRTNFIRIYFEAEHHKDYPNILFSYQKRLEASGNLKAYNYWLLRMGEPDAFKEWIDENHLEFEKLSNWLSENPLELSENNFFHTSQY